MGQLLAAIVCLACFRPSSGREGFWIVMVILLMYFIQLPASVVAHPATFAVFVMFVAPTPDGPLLPLLACQWVFTAFANYAVVVYGVPALARRTESRRPFEWAYKPERRRRPEMGRMIQAREHAARQ